jgi:hypothetical protein
MHYVLDQNFPSQVFLLPWPDTIQLSELRVIRPDLTADVEDWQVLHALGSMPGIDGFITNDAKMLNLSKEMIALSRTGLALIITRGVGDNPLQATGLVLVHLHEISRRATGTPQIYAIGPSRLQAEKPGSYINKIAGRMKMRPPDLISAELVAMGIGTR